MSLLPNVANHGLERSTEELAAKTRVRGGGNKSEQGSENSSKVLSCSSSKSDPDIDERVYAGAPGVESEQIVPSEEDVNDGLAVDVRIPTRASRHLLMPRPQLLPAV